MEAHPFRYVACARGAPARFPATGDYFVRQVANASVIVTRDDQGNVRAFHNVCRHRGTMLCQQAEGKFAGRIQCQYHAWTYKLDGTLASAPHMEKVQGFCESGLCAERKSQPAVWDGAHFHQPFRASYSVRPASGRARSQIRAVAHGGTPDGGTTDLSPQGKLETHHPELF